jgi:hypothetical protein
MRIRCSPTGLLAVTLKRRRSKEMEAVDDRPPLAKNVGNNHESEEL